MGQVEGFINGQAQATIRLFSGQSKREVIGGPAPLLWYDISYPSQLATLKEILSAPKNPPRAAIRSK